MNLIEKLQAIKERWINIQEQLSDPALIKDMKKYKSLHKDYKDMKPVVETFEQYKKILDNYDFSYQILNTEKDEELKVMAKEELITLEEKKMQLLKSEQVPAVMKPEYLLAIFIKCMQDFVQHKAGKLMLLI